MDVVVRLSILLPTSGVVLVFQPDIYLFGFGDKAYKTINLVIKLAFSKTVWNLLEVDILRLYLVSAFCLFCCGNDAQIWLWRNSVGDVNIKRR